MKLASRHLGRKSRLRLVNGVVMSKILYVIQIWGATKITWIRKMQIAWNLAARFVTRMGRQTRRDKLLTECKCVSVNQLVMYHLLMLMFRIIKYEQWSPVRERFEVDGERRVKERGARLDLAIEFWHRWMAMKWSNLPDEMRYKKNVKKFKISF